MTPRLDSICAFASELFNIAAIKQAYATLGLCGLELARTFELSYVVRRAVEDSGDVAGEKFWLHVTRANFAAVAGSAVCPTVWFLWWVLGHSECGAPTCEHYAPKCPPLGIPAKVPGRTFQLLTGSSSHRGSQV